MGPLEGLMMEEGMYNAQPLFDHITSRFNNTEAIKALNIGIVNVLNGKEHIHSIIISRVFRFIRLIH